MQCVCEAKRQTEQKTGFSEQLLDFNILQLADSKDSALFSEEKVESTF